MQGARIVIMLPASIVLFLPILSNREPDNSLPKPLHMERAPTNEVASTALAPMLRAISFVRLITTLPTAAIEMEKK